MRRDTHGNVWKRMGTYRNQLHGSDTHRNVRIRIETYKPLCLLNMDVRTCTHISLAYTSCLAASSNAPRDNSNSDKRLGSIVSIANSCHENVMASNGIGSPPIRKQWGGTPPTCLLLVGSAAPKPSRTGSASPLSPLRGLLRLCPDSGTSLNVAFTDLVLSVGFYKARRSGSLFTTS